MSFSLSGFGKIVLEIVDDVDPAVAPELDAATIGAKLLDQERGKEQALVDDATEFVHKHLEHFKLGEMIFNGAHLGKIDIVDAAKSLIDPSPAAVPTEAASAEPAVDAPAGPSDPTAVTEPLV